MRREEEGAGHRHLRVQSLVFEELVALLRDDVSDPHLFDVTVVAVALSVDYRHAKVHFVLPAAPLIDARPFAGTVALRALERARPFLRARLAEAIEMKRVPDLRFIFDGATSREAAEGEHS